MLAQVSRGLSMLLSSNENKKAQPTLR